MLCPVPRLYLVILELLVTCTATILLPLVPINVRTEYHKFGFMFSYWMFYSRGKIHTTHQLHTCACMHCVWYLCFGTCLWSEVVLFGCPCLKARLTPSVRLLYVCACMLVCLMPISSTYACDGGSWGGMLECRNGGHMCAWDHPILIPTGTLGCEVPNIVRLCGEYGRKAAQDFYIGEPTAMRSQQSLVQRYVLGLSSKYTSVG